MDFEDTPTEVPGLVGGGGLNDILSLALKQSGFDSAVPSLISTNEFSGLDSTLTDSLLPTDVSTLTEQYLSGISSYPSTSFLDPTSLITTTSNTHNFPLLHTPNVPLLEVNGGSVDLGLMNFPSNVTTNEDELSVLLNDAGTEYLQSLSECAVSTPLPQVPTETQTALPIPQTPSVISSSDLASISNMDVNDVLLQLGLDSNDPPPPPHFPPPQTISRSLSSTPPQTVSRSPSSTARRVTDPVPLVSVSGMIGSVNINVVSTGSLQNRTVQQSLTSTEDELEDEDDQFSSADTYANYRPSKLKLGYEHPDPIVESSSLASVEPPQVWFDLKFPEMVIEEVRLSALQLEAVVYACQQHMNLLADGSRSGFLIGDGAGVGKGRTIAGIIYQNYIEGRKKALWLSVSNDLKYDAIRDLHDVGAKKINVYALNKFHYGKISGKRNGRVRKGVIFATYSSLIGESSSGGKYRTRLNQLLHWLGPHFDGVVVFDECHKAKNLVPTGASKPSKTGLTVLQLQKKLPKARIVYCSATGASEPRNMAYMSRLGIWGIGTQFQTFHDFIKSVERRGVGAMEIVAMDMKLRGMYIARQLSFSGVTFTIEEISLSKEFITMYDSAVEFWVEARRLFKEAADLLDYDRKRLKTMWGQFWAAHQRFFKYLCIAAKVPSTIKLAKEAIKNGKCVVIGLQSTGEARTLEQLGQSDGELEGFVSTARGALETLIKRHFPTPSEGIKWSLFENDPTLPLNRRKRKRGARGLESVLNSDDSSSGWENSDSAMETSDDEDEEDEEEVKMEVDDEEDSEESEDESDSNNDSKKSNDFNPLGLFGPDEPRWLKPNKTKKRKISPNPVTKSRNKKNGNYSIKPPDNSRPKGQEGELKFNYKTLRFERLSPSRNLDRRRTIGATEGIGSVQRPTSIERHNSLQPASSGNDNKSLIEVMSNSAMSTESQSGLRHMTVRKMREQLEMKLAELGPLLPTNSLDELIDGLGGPSCVSEMTGRRGRVVTMLDGSVQYQLRTEVDVSVEMLNITEKQRFMDGEKNVAIISEAASSGISLQSDKRAKNQKRRVHITLELPWSADKAIQQFGRTHRSNQVNAPNYVFLISKLSGEQRFASIVAKRLESLGALTHGDRRATESRDLSRYNVDTKFGRQALEVSLRSLVGQEPRLAKSMEYDQEFIDKARVAMTNVELLTHEPTGQLSVDKESMNMSRFLNRLLGLPVVLQNQVFSYFTDTLEEVTRRAKRAGRWDGGILDIGASGEHVEVVESEEFVGDPAFGTATTQLHRIQFERGMSFSEALEKLNADYHPEEGFYLSKKPRNEKLVAVMLKISEEGSKSFLVHRPNTGVQSRPEELKSLKKKYTLSTPEEAEKWWNLQYDVTLSNCSHSYWQGRCKLSIVNHPCEVGMRRRTYHILTGSLLGVWTHFEGVFARHPSQAHKMQIVRVHTPGRKLVGILIPAPCVLDLRVTLQKVALQAAGSAEDPVVVS